MIVVPRNINQTALLSSNYVKKPRTQIYIHQNIGTRVHLSKDKDVSTYVKYKVKGEIYCKKKT